MTSCFVPEGDHACPWRCSLTTWMTLLLVPGLLLAQAPEPRKVEGKDLKAVPGPMTGTPRLADPVGRLGNSRMELEIRRSARNTGYVPAVVLPEGDLAIDHKVVQPAGWQAYQVDVAPGERLHARLKGIHEAWFLVRCVNRQGQVEEGMLQNLIATGNPEASYKNPGKTMKTVYLVVDTSELQADEHYTLTVRRVRGEGK